MSRLRPSGTQVHKVTVRSDANRIIAVEFATCPTLSRHGPDFGTARSGKCLSVERPCHMRPATGRTVRWYRLLQQSLSDVKAAISAAFPVGVISRSTFDRSMRRSSARPGRASQVVDRAGVPMPTSTWDVRPLHGAFRKDQLSAPRLGQNRGWSAATVFSRDNPGTTALFAPYSLATPTHDLLAVGVSPPLGARGEQSG